MIAKKFYKWWKNKVDQWMQEFQRDPDVSLEEWKQIKAEYKAHFGETYIRSKEKTVK